MALGMLRSAKWLRNHGVSLLYSAPGSSPERRYIAPDGELTVGQASRLLRCSEMRIYRMEKRGAIRLRPRNGVAMVPLGECRKARRLILTQT